MPPPTFSGVPSFDPSTASSFLYPRLKPKGPPRQKFTVSEDSRLRALVAELGTNDWGEVAARLGTRSARQCRERFKNYLSPNLRNGQWSVEEDRLLGDKYAEYGAKWSMIVSFFPSRSEVNLKNRWTQLQNGGHDLEKERVRVLEDLNRLIAGEPEEKETEIDLLGWSDSAFDFMRSGFDDSQFL